MISAPASRMTASACANTRCVSASPGDQGFLRSNRRSTPMRMPARPPLPAGRQPSPATSSARRSHAASRAITPGTPLTKPIGKMPVVSKRPWVARNDTAPL
jgi:hypothetical protein